MFRYHRDLLLLDLPFISFINKTDFHKITKWVLKTDLFLTKCVRYYTETDGKINFGKIKATCYVK